MTSKVMKVERTRNGFSVKEIDSRSVSIGEEWSFETAATMSSHLRQWGEGHEQKRERKVGSDGGASS